MATYKIGTKIVLEGESEYRNALKNVNAAQKENRSEMKLWSAEFKENQNSVEALTKKHQLLTKQIETQKQKVSTYETVLKKNSNAEEKAAKKVDELKEAYDSASKEMKRMKEDSTTTAEALKEQEDKVADLKAELKLAEAGYDATVRKMADYQSSLNFAKAEQRAMESELERTEKYLNEAKRATDGNATSIDRYGKEVQEAAEQTSVFGEVLKADLVSSAIKKGIEELAAGITKIATAATEAGTSFEASMSQVAATMGMTTEEIENGSDAYNLLSDAAKKSGAETMFSATEAGEALNYLALAGYDAEKAAATLPRVLDLAAAGGLDLAYASDLVTDSMAAMGMQTDELDNYIDEMARTSQKSNTNVAQLGEATLVCAGTVSLAGQSLETMNTELGVLANNGIKGAEGGTHLRNIILSLSAPTDTAAAAIESLGLKIADSQGNMRDMNDIMIDLNAALSGMSATEKTQIISTIFNKTDIAAVNALLKGTGDEYNNLNAEIKNCSGAASEMAKTLNNNLKGKVTELNSGLEGLGITAYEIFDDDMKKAVDAATEAVRRLQKSMSSGSLSVSMNKMAKSMGEFAEKAIDVGEDALPVVIDGFTWLLDNSDLVIAGISGIVAANVEMKVAPIAIEATKKAWESYQLVTQGAATWQEALNLAMGANPAGIIITAVTALTAAVAAYIVLNRENEEVTSEVTQATHEQAESLNEVTQSLKEAKANREENKKNMEAEASVCRNLVKELTDLQSKTSLNTAEQIKQKLIVDKLNKAIPDLNLAIDKQTGKLNMSTKALTENVEAGLTMLKMEAAREDLAEIAEKQMEAEKELAKAKEQLTAETMEANIAQSNYNRVMQEAKDQYGEMTELYGELGEAAEGYFQAYQKSQEAQEEVKQSIQEAENEIALYGQQYEETMQYISNTEGLETAAGATADLGDAAAETGGKFTEMSEAAQEACQEMSEDLYETISGQMNLFSEFDAKMELSTQTLLTNMESQITGISQWSENIKELADRGIDKGLLKTLADMGPEGAGYVATFVSMTDEELKKANELYKEAMSLPTEVTDEIMDSYINAGTMAGEGYRKGIHDKYDDINKAAKEMGSGSVKTLEKELRIQSPSKETEEAGEYFDEGFGNGINKGTQAVLKIVSDFCTAMIVTTKQELDIKIFEEIGESIPKGIAKGIDAQKDEVLKSVKRLLKETESTTEGTSVKMVSSGLAAGSGSANAVAGNKLQMVSGALSYVPEEMKRMESIGRSERSMASRQNSTFDMENLKTAITNAVEKGMSKIRLSASANINEQAIIDITVEANEDYRNRTGRSIYDD